nr:hypothetical protein [uncultured Trichococcus sp.]
MAFNLFKRKKPEVPEVVDPPKPDNRIDADLLLMQIQLMHENYFHVAKHKSGKGEPRGYCRALKDIESIVRGMKQEGVTE